MTANKPADADRELAVDRFAAREKSSVETSIRRLNVAFHSGS